jgi:SLT domain-containing protein
LSLQKQDNIVHQISDGYANMHPWTMADIIQCASEQYGKTIDPNSMRHVLHGRPRVGYYRGIPMAEKCL